MRLLTNKKAAENIKVEFPPKGWGDYKNYWERLNSLGIPNYLELVETGELILIVAEEKRKRKKGGLINQVYYQSEDGRWFHASKTRKIDEKVYLRDLKINKILQDEK
jgi:hypothetical protein